MGKRKRADLSGSGDMWTHNHRGPSGVGTGDSSRVQCRRQETETPPGGVDLCSTLLFEPAVGHTDCKQATDLKLLITEKPPRCLLCLDNVYVEGIVAVEYLVTTSSEIICLFSNVILKQGAFAWSLSAEQRIKH